MVIDGLNTGRSSMRDGEAKARGEAVVAKGSRCSSPNDKDQGIQAYSSHR